MVRIADLKYISKVLEEMHADVRSRFSTEFWDINRFPRGFIRSAVITFNRIWFSLGLPAALSVGNAIIAEKLPPSLWDVRPKPTSPVAVAQAGRGRVP